MRFLQVAAAVFLVTIPASGVAGAYSATNRPPLHPKAFAELPIGSIQPTGWLRLQLERMRDGLTGHLDERYPKVVGARNGWLGGDGDGWERGPYWLDGLVPLAYILRDEKLMAKARPWIEWTLTHQEPSGYLGPRRFDHEPPVEAGIQKTPREDWWPRMVMLKVLQQYHSATGDPRVIDVLLRYFRYQLKELPRTPLDHWSFWANRRGGDNLMVVYWLYNQTGESFLLELARIIHQQTFPWTEVFLNDKPDPSPDLAHLYPYNTGNRYPFKPELIRRLSVDQLQSFHCVNLAQGIKAPVVYYQQEPDSKFVRAVKKALEDIRKFHGQPQGMYGGDEPMHGNDPTQGIELCSIVELMFSLETMLAITGDLAFADHLERIAYNALPAQSTEDYQQRQYFQSANQVLVSRARRNFYEEDSHGNTDLCFGLLTGYPCCTCNMHQGWPKLVQNLFYATPDRGLAALIYSPGEVRWTVGDQVAVTIAEKTAYPFEEQIEFTFNPEKPVHFPFYLRRPEWASGFTIKVNGRDFAASEKERLIKVDREWKANDTLQIAFEAQVRLSRWVENSVAVERGPLVYALRITEEWQRREAHDMYGEYFEVHPRTPWNYGLLEKHTKSPESGFVLARQDRGNSYPWTLKGAPIVLRTEGKRIPEWQLYNQRAGPLPHSRPHRHLRDQPADPIELVPYGCTRLRITEFPVVE